MSDQDDPICNKCGNPRSKHGVDQYTLEPVKCPVYRQTDPTPPNGNY